jgi:outer membrane receptor protein involved in Fe transport
MKGFQARHAMYLATATMIAALHPPAVAAQSLPSNAAQEDASSQDPGVNVSDEIIVTAQKRAQKLSDIGATVQAATGDQLRLSGVNDVTQLAATIPSFASSTGFAGFPVFALRGVSFSAIQISAPPAVSVYIDEAPLPYSFMTGGILLDVERVEVVKGPQGTLFGENATGGSINVIAAKPTSTPEAGLRSEVNHFGQVMLEGYVSGPLSNTLRARVAASTTQFGAWQRGYFLNRDKNGDQNKIVGRLLLDWTPTDRLTVAVNLSGNRDRSEAQQAQLSQLVLQVPGNVVPGLIAYGSNLPDDNRDADIDIGLNTRNRNSFWQAVVRADYELSDAVKITSLTEYAHAKALVTQNIDATAIPSVIYRSGGSDKTISQELRVSGAAARGKLNYILGINYKHDELTDFQYGEFPGYSGLPYGAQLYNIYAPKSETAAAFGNVDVEIASGLTLTGGIRYTRTKQSITGCTQDGGNGLAAATLGGAANLFRGLAGLPPTNAYVPGGCVTIDDRGASPTFLPVFLDASQKESNISWRAGINYKPNSDTLFYVLASRAFKAGVFPVQSNIVASEEKPVKQERLTSYEVGAKLSFLDRAVRLNIAGFYYDYRDKQFFTFVPTLLGPSTFIVNIPKSRVYGIDADAVIRPNDNLTFRAAITYLNTRVGDYTGFSFDGRTLDFTGSEFNYAPPLSGTFDAQYRQPVSEELSVMFGASGQYNSRTYADLGEATPLRIPSYMLLNLRVGLESNKGRSLTAWVRNLTDKYYWNNVVAGGDARSRFTGLPRTFGMSASFNF